MFTGESMFKQSSQKGSSRKWTQYSSMDERDSTYQQDNAKDPMLKHYIRETSSRKGQKQL